MKTEDYIIGFEALWDSMMKCKRSVLWKDSTMNFVLNGVQEVTKLSNELEDGTYKERGRKYFTVTYPKERQIMSIAFRDRVYQRSLNDVVIYPVMSKSFIYDNAACQKGKGADFARERMKRHMEKYYRKFGPAGYVLKIDIRKYYDSMKHDEVKKVFAKKLPENVYERAAKILDVFPGDTGFNPGSQIIQIAGISLLDPLDHNIKERLRVKYYSRYMDDMVLIGNDHKQMQEWLEAIAEKLREIGLEVHPKKTKILTLREGVLWLGYHYRLTGTGKVVMTVDPKRVQAARKKYYRLVKKAKRGEISREKVDQSYQCWRTHASKGDGWRMLKNMDEYYQGLWKDGDADGNAEDCTQVVAPWKRGGAEQNQGRVGAGYRGG